ncbi:MAG: caspase family protein [Candidatus Thiodiazotropha sp.]
MRALNYLMQIQRRFIALICLSLSLTSFAVVAKPGTDRLALVIGNGEYEQLSDLRNAVDDAELVARTLETLGFRVTLLKNQDDAEMLEAVLGFGEKLVDRPAGEAVLFYYSGHGVQQGGDSYLLPVDYAVDSVETSITLQDVLQELQGGNFDSRIIVVDACREDARLGNNPLTFRHSNAYKVPHGTILAFSTSSSDPAVDGSGRYSPYTKALTTAMKQPGLDATGVFRETGNQVLKKTNGQQQPQMTGLLTREFFFKPGGKPSARVNFIEEESRAWKKVRLSNNAADYIDFISRFPDGEFSKIARKRYQILETNQADEALAQSRSKYGVVLVRRVDDTSDNLLVRVAEVDSDSLLSGKLIRNDVVLTINHKPVPDGKEPNNVLDQAFDTKGRLDLLVRRGASVYNISVKK